MQKAFCAFFLIFLFPKVSFSGPATYVVQSQTEVKMMQSSFKVDDQKPPIVSVQFPHLSQKGLSLYARLYSQGTSGQVFEYFVYKEGKFQSLGHYPEILYDEEKKEYFSLERDSRRVLKTSYSFNGNSFIKTGNTLLGGDHE